MLGRVAWLIVKKLALLLALRFSHPIRRRLLGVLAELIIQGAKGAEFSRPFPRTITVQ